MVSALKNIEQQTVARLFATWSFYHYLPRKNYASTGKMSVTSVNNFFLFAISAIFTVCHANSAVNYSDILVIVRGLGSGLEFVLLLTKPIL